MRNLSVCLLAVSVLGSSAAAQRRPEPPPSRYSYTMVVDAKSLPKGVSVRTLRAGGLTRIFIKNTGKKPLVINEIYQNKRLVSGAKLVSGQVFQYFPNGVPMAGKRHLKGWQAPFGVIKETLLRLPKDPKNNLRGSQTRPVPQAAAA